MCGRAFNDAKPRGIIAISFLLLSVNGSALLTPGGSMSQMHAARHAHTKKVFCRKGPVCELTRFGAIVSPGDGPIPTLLDNAGSIIPHHHVPDAQRFHFHGLSRPRNHFLVGNISSALLNFASRVRPALARLLDIVDPLDLAVLVSLAFGTEFILRLFNCRVLDPFMRRNESKAYEASKLSTVGKTVCQFGQCSLTAYLCEIFIVFLDAVGLRLPNSAARDVVVSIYSVWAARQLCLIKGDSLRRFFKRRERQKRGRYWASKGVFVDRLADIIIYLVTGIVAMDMCNVQVGMVVKSILSVAGLSSLILGLSLRDPATQILQGASLLLLDRFGPGDKIKLADGTIGRVTEIGWMDTQLMGSDNICLRIPNSELASRRVYNISRTKRSQVKQKLRFRYADIDKISDLIRDIKSEIRGNCPKLVDDGSRPFRVTWRDYSDDHITVVVNTHFNIAPLSSEYYDTVEKVLLAIARAVKDNRVQFALPSRVHLKEP